mmetsp:Transcript_23861/g.70799  ORF Transcript_23861/g.70799 Transcript_23861/m.70799 type:complete len:238 (-) Transcript_23861:490-1203(-)
MSASASPACDEHWSSAAAAFATKPSNQSSQSSASSSGSSPRPLCISTILRASTVAPSTARSFARRLLSRPALRGGAGCAPSSSSSNIRITASSSSSSCAIRPRCPVGRFVARANALTFISAASAISSSSAGARAASLYCLASTRHVSSFGGTNAPRTNTDGPAAAAPASDSSPPPSLPAPWSPSPSSSPAAASDEDAPSPPGSGALHVSRTVTRCTGLRPPTMSVARRGASSLVCFR